MDATFFTTLAFMKKIKSRYAFFDFFFNFLNSLSYATSPLRETTWRTLNPKNKFVNKQSK